MNINTLTSLYTEHRKKLTCFAMSILKNVEQAEECVQEAFIACMLSVEQPDDPAAYFGTAVVNRAKLMYRKGLADSRKIQNITLIDEVFGLPAPSAEQLLEGLQFQQLSALAVSAGLAKLPPRQRQAMELYFFEEQKNRTGCVTMGCSVETVKAHRLHALRKLREDERLLEIRPLLPESP